MARAPATRSGSRSWSARSAWSSATSAPARSTRCRRCSTRATRTRSRSARDNVYGVVSLVFWSVMIIVTVTYVLLAMRADNDGEGGIMALITLLRRLGAHARAGGPRSCWRRWASSAPSLFFGDSMITPAISVLSAVEGLKVVEPSLDELRRADHRGDHRRAVPGAAPGHGGGRPAVRAGDDRLVRGHRRVRRRRHRRAPGRSSRRCRRRTRWASWSATSASRSSRWPRSCSRSPAPRRSTPTWATSAAARSPAAGSSWSSRPACSATSARAR